MTINPKNHPHKCSECKSAGSCPIEIIMRPFENDTLGMLKFDNDLTKLLDECGDKQLVLGILINLHKDPIDLIKASIAIGYALGKGAPPVRYKMGTNDVLTALSMMDMEPPKNAS